MVRMRHGGEEIRKPGFGRVFSFAGFESTEFEASFRRVLAHLGYSYTVMTDGHDSRKSSD